MNDLTSSVSRVTTTTFANCQPLLVKVMLVLPQMNLRAPIAVIRRRHQSFRHHAGIAEARSDRLPLVLASHPAPIAVVRAFPKNELASNHRRQEPIVSMTDQLVELF